MCYETVIRKYNIQKNKVRGGKRKIGKYGGKRGNKRKSWNNWEEI